MPIQPSTQSPQASSNFRFPAISATNTNLIQHGKYVNFDSLLPSSLSHPSSGYSIHLSQSSAGLDGEMPFTIQPQSSRRTIKNFPSWLSAWNIFIQAFCFFFPGFAGLLLAYQSQITIYASRYEFSAWSTYDKLFRQNMANLHPNSPWSVVDRHLFDEVLLCAPVLAVCHVCREPGHYSSSCPHRVSSSHHASASGATPQRPTAPSLPPFLAPSEEPNLLSVDQLVPTRHHVDFSTPALAPSVIVDSFTYALSAGIAIPPPSVPTVQALEVDCSHLTPVKIPELCSLLQDHPDQELVSYVVNGLQFGFSTGFCGQLPHSASSNLKSSFEFFSDVSKAIHNEVERGHTAGPFAVPPLRDFHCSPLGAVPKKDGSARIILDLSSPRGSSVNEGIDNQSFTVKYCSIDDALDMVHSLGPSAFMAKADIKHAFRLCPVKPAEWHLLGYQ